MRVNHTMLFKFEKEGFTSYLTVPWHQIVVYCMTEF